MSNEYHQRLLNGEVDLKPGTAKEAVKISYICSSGTYEQKLSRVMRRTFISSRTKKPVTERSKRLWVEDVRICGDAALSPDGLEIVNEWRNQKCLRRD